MHLAAAAPRAEETVADSAHAVESEAVIVAAGVEDDVDLVAEATRAKRRNGSL